MLNSLLLPALVANIAVFYYLNASRIKTYAFAVRRERQIKAFRIAGLLVVLVAVAQGQGTNGTNNSHDNPNTTRHVQIPRERQSAAFETPFVAGVVRDGDTAAAQSWGWNAQMGYSRGDDVIYHVTPDEQDWTNFFWDAKTSKTHPKMAAFFNYVWTHAGTLLILAFVCFAVTMFAGGHEADETNIHDQLDPEYRTGFTNDYHGDDAFEVPDGMHSQHEVVPVRSRSAAAGR
jgi:hypothetical protein